MALALLVGALGHLDGATGLTMAPLRSAASRPDAQASMEVLRLGPRRPGP